VHIAVYLRLQVFRTINIGTTIFRLMKRQLARLITYLPYIN